MDLNGFDSVRPWSVSYGVLIAGFMTKVLELLP